MTALPISTKIVHFVMKPYFFKTNLLIVEKENTFVVPIFILLKDSLNSLINVNLLAELRYNR